MGENLKTGHGEQGAKKQGEKEAWEHGGEGEGELA